MLDAAARICHAYLRGFTVNPAKCVPKTENEDWQLKKDA
jgi:hypothetical protein